MKLSIFLILGLCVLVEPFPDAKQFLKPCSMNSTCSCNNVDGYIDLHALANTDGSPRFANINGGVDYVFYFNPCSGFNMNEGNTGNECSGAAICQHVVSADVYYTVGTANSVQSVFESEYGLMFRYTATSETQRTAYVILNCDQSKDGELTFLKENPPTFYYFNLYSKHACPLVKPTAPPVVPTTTTTTTTTTPRPTQPPPPPQPQPVIFSIKAVVVLLLSILFVLTLVCGLIILAICVFSAKFQTKKSSTVEYGRSVRGDTMSYPTEDLKRQLKQDFYNQDC